MIRLFKCEFRKFKSTYINSLSFLGMLFPVFLVFIVFLVKKEDFIKMKAYDWDNFNRQLSMFFLFFVGPIITSFISVFTVYYEYQQLTIKNLLMSPHGRIPVILTKIVYISVFILLQYAVVAAMNVLCAALLGFDVTYSKVLEFTRQMLMSGLSTLMLVPLMMFITLLFKGFIPGMIMTVVGSMANVLMLNWEKSYIWPWSIPADIAFIATKQAEMNIMYPVTFACVYFTVFMVITFVYFSVADQNV